MEQIKSPGTVTFNALDAADEAQGPRVRWSAQHTYSAAHTHPHALCTAQSLKAFLLSIKETQLPATTADSTPDGASVPVVRLGVCLVEASTSDVFLAEFNDDRQRMRLRTLLVEMPPVEVRPPQ